MKQNNLPKNRRLGIKWKMFGYMMLFLVLLLGLLWFFQVVLFGEIYKMVRISEIKKEAETICENIELDNYKLTDMTDEISETRQVCTLVFDEFGNVLASSDRLTDCIIHSMPGRSVYMLYEFAEQSGGEKMTRFKLDGFRNLQYVLDDTPYPMPKGEDNSTESIIYTKIVRSEIRGRNVAVMLNATISPVASTVRALQNVLVIISGGMIILAALLSFFLAKRVSAPIVSLNRSAKELAEGNYDAAFKADGYLEISELAETLTLAASELSKTGKLQKELVANISHDLRTPLTMIKGYAEMMRDIPDENTGENLQIIIDESERLSSLVSDVLDISRIQSGVHEIRPTEFDLTETVSEVIGRFSKLAATKSRKIDFIYDCHAVVSADRTQILQVVYNFIINALNHSEEDTEVTVTQKIIRSDTVNKVRIEVMDRGEGIPEADLKNIFDRYYKVDKHHRRSGAGSGLGLSIVKGILEMHGAGYGVESEVGKGSTFWFEL